MMKCVDLILRSGNVYNTFLKRFEKKDVAILGGKFYYIAPDLKDFEAKEEVWCEGRYIIPGLIDIHMHIESSMTVPSAFSKMVLPHGVTTVVADPHEIANVLGLNGIKSFLSSETTLDIFYGIPSSVPSTHSGLETTGGSIGLEELEVLLEHPKVICLGEVMNFPDLISDEETLIKAIISRCQAAKPYMPIEGHCPKISGLDLARFIYAGVDADHTQQTPESIYEKITNGMFLEIQRKSLTHETVKMLVTQQFYEYFALVTDDVMADHLKDGHLNKVIQMAVDLGMPIEQAIYCSTYTPARRMHLGDRGAIAPGKLADFVILSELDMCQIEAVYKNGKCYESECAKQEDFGEEAYHSVKCERALKADFVLYTEKKTEVTCNVIQINPHGNFTTRVKRTLPVVRGQIQWESSGLALLVVYERYGKNGNKAYALVEGALTRKGAVATTWAHDHHNLMVMGTSSEDMLAAQHEVVAMQGGYVVCEHEQVVASARLNVGGIVSDGPLEVLAEELKAVRNAMRNLGYQHLNEIMSFSTLSLPVSPEIKMTDLGMLDTRTQQFITLEDDES
ncbi:MAG: adenine deaminase C-terminal domain-containing protein [Cellulosilyticaceae bacterium]